MKALAALPGELLAVMHGSTPNHLHLRQRLATLVASILVIDAVASVLAWRLERNLPRSDIHHYGDALFWTTTQLITVSSQMRNPVTGPGMVLDVVIEFLGITVVAALAGSLGSFLYRRSMERNPLPHHPRPSAPDQAPR
jgi:hypothetical protein